MKLNQLGVIFYAFGLFMYQTFDGCDGCHARRTGQSGPLGNYLIIQLMP